MRILLAILLSFVTIFGFGQAVDAPDPKSFTVNTSEQDASGFVLSGFGATETLLASISLVNPPSGTTFYLNTTTNLTAASGFTLSGNKTRLVVTGTMASINTALSSLKVNTGSLTGDVNISVAATVNPIGFFYNGVNGHFYKPLTATADRTTYTNARARSLLTTFKGQTGYLVTITSTSEEEFIRVNVPATNVWFAATDEVKDGTWVIDAGPEKGIVMKTANGQLNGNIVGVYNNWCGGEPNGSNGSENYAVAKWNGAACWNDLSNNWNNPYVIEYGTWTNPDDATFTEFYSNSVVHSNGETLKAVFNFNFGSNITESNFSSKLFKRNDATSVWTSGGDYKALNGLGKVYLSNQLDTAKLYSSAIQAATQNDMTAYSETDIGKIYKMTITGAGGGGWGTDIYTNDSYIPAMAVHAGVITIGQTKEVYIKVVEGKNNYPGSTRNGITTSEWGAWGLSYQFVNEPSSYKATISPGQAEFSYVNISNGTTTLYIDLTRFGNTQPSTISKVKILDVYDGPVTYQQTSTYWAHYIVPSSLPKVTDGTSAFAANIRNANYNNWAFTSNINFAQNGAYKQHKLEFQQYDSVQLKTLYNSIVTVSDVYLAFKEVSNGGIFGNQSGNEFGYGIQFKNADVDDNGIFNEADCFTLLQNLIGTKDLVNSYTLDNTMKIISDSTYATIGKSNWQQFPNYLGKEYGFSLLDGVTNYTYNLAITWKGDVNLSHSATPPSNGITTMSANFAMQVKTMGTSLDPTAYTISEIKGDSLIVYIKFNPNSKQIVGTQFQINYDNTILKYSGTNFKTTGSPINFGTDKGSFINLGSINTSGELLDGSTEYRLVFKLNKQIPNSLGLLSIGSNEAVDKDGKPIKIKIQ